MKKQLNVDSIQSELRGGSAFFPGYKGADSPTPPSEETKEQPDTTGTATTVSTPLSRKGNVQGVPPKVPQGGPQQVPPRVSLIPKKAKRPIRQRQPFDIYEDQYQSLKKIADAERGFVNGRSMGQMVREAIDTYLRDHAPSS